MPRISSTALMSYGTVSQALISLGCYYYEHFHDNPNPEVEGLIDVIDKCLVGIGSHDSRVSIERASDQFERIGTATSTGVRKSNEFEPKVDHSAFLPTDWEPPKQCPYCDASIPSDAKVCATCGSSLS